MVLHQLEEVERQLLETDEDLKRFKEWQTLFKVQLEVITIDREANSVFSDSTCVFVCVS